MIDLMTGLPGNAKTAYTIAWVRNWAKKDNRAVFYANIPLTDSGKEALGWQPIEAEKWMEAPPNSIVIIDECQKVFRNRTLGQIPGKHVTDLETHRHLGIDLVFITQHPSLIDPAIRRLTGRHRHMVRIWGTEASTVHEWPAVRDNCDKPIARKDSEKQKWKFDKSVYPLYKSAEVHTVKRTIPARLFLLALLPFVLMAAIYAVYSLVYKPAHKEPVSDQSKPAQGTVGPSQSPQAQQVKFDPVADARQFVERSTPRVYGLQHTAPKYDDLTRPTAVPVPAACVVMPAKNRCSCYSQQATLMNVPFNMCIEFARNGYFQEFNQNGNQSDEHKARESAANLSVQDRLPISGASTKDSHPRFVAGNADGYGVLGKAGPGIRRPGVDDDVPAQSQAEERTPRVPAGSLWRAS